MRVWQYCACIVSSVVFLVSVTGQATDYHTSKTGMYPAMQLWRSPGAWHVGAMLFGIKQYTGGWVPVGSGYAVVPMYIPYTVEYHPQDTLKMTLLLHDQLIKCNPQDDFDRYLRRYDDVFRKQIEHVIAQYR